MSKINELSFIINKNSLSQLIDVLKDLSKLNDRVLMKIDKDNVLIYSLVGDGNNVNAFKNFIFKTDELFYKIGDFDVTINYIIRSAKQMFRILQIVSTYDQDINATIYYDTISDGVYSDRINIKVGNKLRHNFYGDDPSKMNTRITVDSIKKIAKIENSLFSFDMHDDDFDKIKKLSSPDEVINIFYLSVREEDGKNYVNVGEGTWDITVAETEYKKPITLAFTKKYFKTINMVNGIAKIHVFDTMVLVITENSNLLISIEVTV